MSYFTLATFSGRAAATRPREGPMVRIHLPPAVSLRTFGSGGELPPRDDIVLDAFLGQATVSKRQPTGGGLRVRIQFPPAESPQTIGSSAAERDCRSARVEPALRRRIRKPCGSRAVEGRPLLLLGSHRLRNPVYGGLAVSSFARVEHPDDQGWGAERISRPPHRPHSPNNSVPDGLRGFPRPHCRR